MSVVLTPLIELPGMVTGIWQRFAVHVFEGKLTLEEIMKMEETGNGWHKKNPGRLVELVIIYPSDAKMTSEERERMARLIKRFEKIRNASATVILATGLVGAMHRSVLTGLQFLAPPPHPVKVFGLIPDAVTFLAPHVQTLCGPEARADTLLPAVNDLCKTFKTRRASAPA